MLVWSQLGSQVHGILLWPLGGLAFMGKSSSPQKDLIVAVAGPATHIPQVRPHLSKGLLVDPACANTRSLVAVVTSVCLFESCQCFHYQGTTDSMNRSLPCSVQPALDARSLRFGRCCWSWPAVSGVLASWLICWPRLTRMGTS